MASEDDASLKLYESLARWADLEALIDTGEAEDTYIECNAPSSPQLGRDLKKKLAKALSGFSNTSGGIFIWGMQTSKHPHSGLDVLDQIVPIAKYRRFLKQVEVSVPRLTTPGVTRCSHKVIVRKNGDTRGVVITHIPRTLGDPVQTTTDEHFYLRCGDEFQRAPYLMIQRLFAATESPDLQVLFDPGTTKCAQDGTWRIPITVSNHSVAVARDVLVSVRILEPERCDNISGKGLNDVSELNVGITMFNTNVSTVVHRGMALRVGALIVKMKKGKRALGAEIRVFAEKMRARKWTAQLQLTKSGLKGTLSEMEYLY